MQKHLRFLLLLFISLTSYTLLSQKNAKSINGRVKSLNNDVSNVLIINLDSKKSTISDSLGLFTIEVKLRDTIKFTALQYLTKEIVITETIFLKNSVVVNLVENVINLNEVTITPYNLTGKIELDIQRLGIEPVVTSSILGLPNADLEVITQSERLLFEADRGKYARFMTAEEKSKEKNILGYLTIGFIINTHKIMNRVSGRTKLFEDMVARDKKMEMEKEIIAKFSKETMSENFNIPKTNIDGFLTYCLSDTDFSELLKANNTMEIWKYLKTRSIEFKKSDFVNE